jgi:ribonuclease HI
MGKTANIAWAKGHEGTPGNERADVLAGKAARKAGYSKVMYVAHTPETSDFREVREGEDGLA